jgi:hypothetical protein
MRLHELTFPLAILHYEFLTGPVKDLAVSWSVEALKAGYFDNVRLFDADGHEYSILSIELRLRSAVARLFKGKEAFSDLVLKRTATHSPSEFAEVLISFLSEHPDWTQNEEGPWDEAETRRKFRLASSAGEIIEVIGWYSIRGDDYLAPEGQSTKVVVRTFGP